MIGEVRVWNATRTTAQIQQTLTTKLAAPQYGLVGYYDMQAASQQVTDLSAVIYSGRTLSPGTLAADNAFGSDDPTWLTRCNLPCTVQGNFRVAASPVATKPNGEHRVILPDTAGQASRRIVVGASRDAATDLSIVPNPASAAAVLHFNPVVGSAVRGSLLDLAGTERVAAQELTPEQAAAGQYPLPVSKLPPGTCLVLIEGAAGKKFARLQVK